MELSFRGAALVDSIAALWLVGAAPLGGLWVVL